MCSRLPQMRLRIASTTSLVPALPPRSGVNVLPSRKTASTAASMRFAGASKPMYRSMSAAERMAAMGLALFWPSMSGAEPWTLDNRNLRRGNAGKEGTYGSPMTKLSPALTEGTTPREPTRAAAASLWKTLGWRFGQPDHATHDRISP